MSGRLKIGFVPLTDAAPLLAAKAHGLFADAGLEVELVREASWATIRDKLAVGALDAAHMLAPMAVAASLDGSLTAAPFVMSRGGAAVTLGRSAAAAAPFAVVFPFSTHNYLLRDWLSETGMTAELRVAPPHRMGELLAAGEIAGFCAGEPWPSAAVAAGTGTVMLRSRPDAPDKVLGVTEAWAGENPEVLAALLRALDRAAGWVAEASNHEALAALLARPEHLAVTPSLIAASLAHIRFDATRPTGADAAWLAGEMQRWGQAGPESEEVALRVLLGPPARKSVTAAREAPPFCTAP